MSSTAEMLRKLRERTGLNQRDFAASVGMKYTTYNGYETGKHQPKSDVLITIPEADDGKKYTPDTADAATGVNGPGPISLDKSNELLIALGLIKDGQQVSDDDLAFLAHIVGLLEAWFNKRK